MKKIVSFVLCIFLLVPFMICCADAVSIKSSKEDLRDQFLYGIGPEVDGYSLDYRYYSPASSDDTAKYPLVVWLHGHSHGQYDGYQIKSNDIVNWSSDEFQSRFGEVGGAHIMAVRAPEHYGISWSDDLLKPLKFTIDDFILKNSDKVDTTKIYIGGFSLGGMMTFKMAITYPQMFAAIFPICPYITVSDNDAAEFSDVPVWLVSGKYDSLVSYTSMTMKNWDSVVNSTNVAQHCRFSTLSKVCKPDGSFAPSEHYSWEAVTNDMFSSSNGDYPYMSTVTALGETVTLTYPDGMISWLYQFSSNYSIEDIDVSDCGDDRMNLSLFEVIKACFMTVYIVFRNLVRPVFG